MRKHWFKVTIVSALLTFGMAGAAFAHVEVSPTEVRPGASEEFAVDVAGEKAVPAVEVRLEIPEGFEVTDVGAPSGWQGSVEGGSIVWSGGELAQDRGIQFPFQAQAPDETDETTWNGFVTYQDDSVIEWNGPPDSERPASVVQVGSGGAQAGGEGHHGGGEDDEGAEAEQMPDTGGISTSLLLGLVALLGVGALLTVRSLVRSS